MKKKIGIIFILCVSLIIPVVIYAMDTSETILSQNNERERISFLREKNFHEILKQGDLLTEQKEFLKDDSSFMDIAKAILEKRDSVSEQEVIDCILDDSHSDTSREIAIQFSLTLNNYEGLRDKSDLERLLDDEKISFGIKQNLMLALDFRSHDNKKLLEDILQKEDDELAFQAMKTLNRADPELANQYADLILDEKENQSDRRVCSAIKVKYKYFKNENAKGIVNEEEKKEFIAYLKSLIEGNQETEDMFYTALFALSDLEDRDAIRVIIESNIRQEWKRYCIESNYKVLISMLEEDPVLENMQLLTKAASILPLKEFQPSLEKALKILSVRILSDEENKEELQKERNQINEVLASIQKNNWKVTEKENEKE